MNINDAMNSLSSSSIDFRKIKKYLLIALGIILFFIILFIVLLVVFFSHILNFVTSYIPVVSDFLFTYAKDFYMGYFKEDITALISPYLNSANGTELKGIIDNYIQGVLNANNFSFSSLTSFIDSIQNIISDGVISPEELKTARDFIQK